jgi:hypothetical protein
MASLDAEMERHCLDAGFSKIVHSGRKEATERYLAGRGERLRLPAHFYMIEARNG